jgi:hypothetical protein
MTNDKPKMTGATNMVRLSNGWLMVPLLLLLLSVLSYALLIPWLGFYWDDWAGIWVSHSLGAAGLREYASLSRPFEGWIFAWTRSLLGETPVHWHIFAVVIRWLSAVAVWWSLRGLWPEKPREVASIAFLFAVYPGFAVQPSAWIHSQGYFIPLVLFTFSLGAMIWAARTPRLYWPLTILALLTSTISMMLTEHFVGLELLRPLLLWFVLSEQIERVGKPLRRTLVNWSPYVAVTGIFLVWRLFIFKTAVPFLDQSSYFKSIAAHPLFALRSRIRKAFTDVIESSFMAWGQTFRPEIFDLDSAGARYLWIALALIVVSAAVIIFYLLRLKPNVEINAETSRDDSWPKRAIAVGLIAIILGGLPVWFIGRQVDLNSDANRYTLAMMFGACIFLVGLIQLVIRSRRQQIVTIGILAGLAVGFHFRNADLFRKQWSTQESLYWQLSWRVPGLKPGTSILLDAPKSLFDPMDYFLGAPLNLMYAPQHSSPQLNYAAFVLSKDKDLGHDLPELAEGVALKQSFFSISFAGSTSDSLVVWFSPPSCLRVVDPQADKIPQLSPQARAAQPISHLDRIVTNPVSPARPPAEIFGRAPEACWCYYFQKADLAQQMGDWQQVAQMGDEARHLGLKPDDPSEWLLFVEGYANVERYMDAGATAELALQSMSDEPKAIANRSPVQNELAVLTRPAMCTLLKRLEGTGIQNASQKAFIAGINSQLSCVDPSPGEKIRSGLLQ